MSKTLRVALREYAESVRSKAFFIGIVVAPILMSGSGLAMYFLKDHVDLTPKKLAVVDRSGVVADAVVAAAEERNTKGIFEAEGGKQTAPRYEIEIVEPAEDADAQRLALSNRVRSKEFAAFVEIGPDVIAPGENGEAARIAYHAENAALDDMRGWLGWPINDRVRNLRVEKVEIEREKVDAVIKWVPVEALGLVSVDRDTGKVKEARKSSEIQAVLVPLGIAMLLFLLIMMGAMPLLNSVLEEKTQRISEVLLGSARPFQLMMGKLCGNLAVSFTAAAVYLTAGYAVLHFLDMTDILPAGILPWFIVYLVAAIFAVGSMCIAVGAACNDSKEVQSLFMPVIFPVFLPMFVMVPVLKEPTSAFATWLSLFPPCTPILMLIRQSTPGGIPAWQVWTGLLMMAAFTLFCVWAAGRIFRIGLLMQGQPPKLRDLARWAFRG